MTVTKTSNLALLLDYGAGFSACMEGQYRSCFKAQNQCLLFSFLALRLTISFPV